MTLRKTMKRLLGGALALAMALSIFAGTGMEVRAEGGYTYQPYTLPQDIVWRDLYDHCDKIDESEWNALESWLSTLNIAADTVFIVRISDPNCDSVLVAWSGGNWLLFDDDGDNNQRINLIYDSDISGYDKVYTVKQSNVAGDTSESKSLVPCSESESPAPHTHSYSWVTVQDATMEQDGMEEYRCSCGNVQERCVIPASVVFVKGLYGAVKDAPQNGTASFDSGRLYTLSDYVIKKLAERTDVTTVITFEYQNQSYKMTIPAGVDYTSLLADEDYFYGYFYFANLISATIEAL